MQRTAGAVILVLVIAGCGGGGGSGGTGGTSAHACVPGMSVACACTSGAQGAQTCTADGAGYGACMCSGGPGAAGTTGSAGTTGTGGGPGTAGTVGTGGATGAAGSIATAGTSGTAGATGTAGAGGSVGTGGSAGAAGRGGFGGAIGTGGTTGGGGGATGTAGTTGIGGSGGAPINCTGSNYNGRYVSVTFKDAIIGPGKVDHTAWDVGSAGGTLTIPNNVLNDLGTALASSNPVGGAIAVLAGPALNSAIDATAKPDVFGWVSGTAFGVTGDAYYLAQSSERIDNNYTPAWPGTGLTFVNAPIDCDVRFDITLIDYDPLDDNDPIGTPEINSGDLQDALASQQKFNVRVDDQTAGQLLFLGITVVQQPGLLP